MEERELSMEEKLQSSGALMVQKANEMTITTNEQYEDAGRFLVEIKTRMKQVTDYWKEPKAQAASAHKLICTKEKEMMTPLTNAEAIIKKSMVAYQKVVEEERRKEEERLQKLKQEEVDRQLAQAIAAEQNGDQQGAEMSMAMAQMIDDMKPTQAVAKPTASGTSVRKIWKARVVDPKLVPAYVNGIEVREIKMSSLNNLAKMTNGELQVPGVEFYEESGIVARSW